MNVAVDGPAFEVWGVTIRVLQFALLAYLAARPRGDRVAAAQRD